VTRLESHLSSRQVSRIVYGAIFGLTLIVTAEVAHPPRATVMAAWLVVTGVTVAVAEVYSEVVGIETSERHRVTRQQFAHLLAQGWAVARGAHSRTVFPRGRGRFIRPGWFPPISPAATWAAPMVREGGCLA
jgi:hypothetical protein